MKKFNIYKKILLFVNILIISTILCKTWALGTILDYKTDITIEKSSKVHIEETIIYDFGIEKKHGIYRTIPYIKTNQEKKEFKMKIDNIQVTDEKNNKYNYGITYTLEQIELKIGDANKTISGKHTYKISYDVIGAITYFDTFDELYWNAIGTNWQESIKNASVKITYPPTIKKEDIQTICYTGYIGSIEKNCTIQSIENAILITTTKPLISYEGITFATKFPAGHIEIIEPTPVFSIEEFKPTILQIILGSIFIIGWYLIFPFYIASKWIKEKLFVHKNKRIVAAWFDPPKDSNKNYFLPAEVKYLVTQKIESKLLVATIISMAQRKYFKIKPEEQKFLIFKSIDFIFDRTQSKENIKNLAPFEKEIYDYLFSTGDIVSSKILSEEKFYNIYIDFNEKIDDRLHKQGLITKNIGKEPITDKLKLAGLIIAATFTFNMLLVIATILWSKKVGYTKIGVEKLSEALSLKNFLTSQDAQFNFMAKEQMFFEKLLPYATAFDVEKKWIQRFKDKININPEWYEGSLVSNNGLFALSININSNIGSARSKATASSSTSNFSSGFSGGSSGGGGGGGGGGSW